MSLEYLGYLRLYTNNIPNLSYGKGVADKTPTRDKIQDEHTLRKISKEKGFDTVVLGRNVHMAV